MSNIKKLKEAIKGGAIAKSSAKEILEAIKSDPELSAMKTHLGVSLNGDAEKIHETLEPDDQIIAQKFNLYGEDGNLKETVIVWAPCTVEDFLRMSGISKDGQGVYMNTVDRDHRPSFLGKNIKKAFTSAKELDQTTKDFVSSFMEGDFQLGNNVFYQIYVSFERLDMVMYAKFKVARDFNLSPKKVKKEA